MINLQFMSSKTRKIPCKGKDFKKAAESLVKAGHMSHKKGWVPATSGNFSIKVSDECIAITVSGKHKGKLEKNDIMPVDASGKSLDGRKPSAETPIHTMIYMLYPEIRCILHTHSIFATMLSKYTGRELVLDDYELLKAFQGIQTHATALKVPVFINDQDTKRLAEIVREQLSGTELCFGFLIEGHGLYTWGTDIEDTERHLEAFEFLFECEILKMKAGLK
ncbi:MAG: methylthioribulose 1-phosphate dehydratase [Spirochaetia bacterium]|nr:methylthioribulose 1-phosphate dehydratase [Spirochaetia bacterium]